MRRKMEGIRLVIAILCLFSDSSATPVGVEENWGDGLKVMTTYMPKECEFRAQNDDVIHYHYVGRLGHNGAVFGKSFDYDSPYIVALGHGRIIAGMDRGLVGTCLWERRRIEFPPSLGYGDRGVGEMIPPNATLVFYIRLIKLKRDGVALGGLFDLKEQWDQGLTYYTDGKHERAAAFFEKAISEFNKYQKMSAICFTDCKNDTDIKLNSKQEDLLSGSDMSKQFLPYLFEAQCVKRCIRQKLPHMSIPDPVTLDKFRKRIPYSYLQYSYYQLGNLDEAIKCALSFFYYHTNNSMILNAIKYYREQLELTNNDFPSREAGLLTHHEHYLAGRTAYNDENWLESADQFEAALVKYKETLSNCLILCDDVLFLNMTQEFVDPGINIKLKKMKLAPDTMDYYTLLRSIIHNYLTCHTKCHSWMATVNGEYFDKYLAGHFHYLQFDYFKTSLLNKAAEAASTYQAMEPSDNVMAGNIKHFRSKMNVPPDQFKPREDFLNIEEHYQTKQRLLKFAASGIPQKRSGSRGDAKMIHEEL